MISVRIRFASWGRPSGKSLLKSSVSRDDDGGKSETGARGSGDSLPIKSAGERPTSGLVSRA